MKNKLIIEGYTDKGWMKYCNRKDLIDFFGAFSVEIPYKSWVENPTKIRITIEELQKDLKGNNNVMSKVTKEI